MMERKRRRRIYKRLRRGRRGKWRWHGDGRRVKL